MTHPIVHFTPIATVLTSTPNPVASQPDYSLANLVLMTVYVAATLVLVGVTIWQARAILATSAQQSKDAIAAIHKQIETSEVQSQAAIAAIHDQIEASKVQSQTAIDAVHEQIKASELQAQETLYNQHRPLLACPNHPMAETEMQTKPLLIKNVGLGIALNARGILSITSSIYGPKFQTGFIIPSIITPNSDPEEIFINSLGMKGRSVADKVGEYSFFPDDKDSSYNQRLVLAYDDIFGRKHLSIYDGRPGTNWKVYKLETNSQRSIEDVITDTMILGSTKYGLVNGL